MAPLGVGQTQIPSRMQSSSTMIRWKGNLGRISEFEKVRFQMRRKETMLFDDLTCSESEFQSVGTATEKNTSPSMSFNSGNRRQVKTRRTEFSGVWVLKKAWKIDMKVLQKKEFYRQ